MFKVSVLGGFDDAFCLIFVFFWSLLDGSIIIRDSAQPCQIVQKVRATHRQCGPKVRKHGLLSNFFFFIDP